MNLDPRTKIILLVYLGLLTVTLERSLSLGIISLVCLLLFGLLPLPWKWKVRGLGVVFALLWSTVFSQGLFYSSEPRVPLFSIGSISIYREGVVHGLVQSLRFISVTLAGIVLVTTTSSDRMLAAMVSMKIPSGLAFMANTALRFVPTISAEWAIVRKARSLRGRPTKDRPPWQWLLLELSLLKPVIARSLRRSRSIAESMDSRGFDASSPRALRVPLKFFFSDYLLLYGMGVFVIFVLAVKMLYKLYLAEVIYFPHLRSLYSIARRLM